jgi:hypothetical protein
MGLVARSGYSKSASADLTLASKRQNGQSRDKDMGRDHKVMSCTVESAG